LKLVARYLLEPVEHWAVDTAFVLATGDSKTWTRNSNRNPRALTTTERIRTADKRAGGSWTGCSPGQSVSAVAQEFFLDGRHLPVG
jgi:hypothetical protein